MATMDFHVPKETTPEVEKAFEELRENGIKKVRTSEINWNVLDNHRRSPEDVSLNVGIELIRQRDAGSVYRRILAEDTASVIEQELKKTFKGDADDCDVCLAVRVVLTSQGNKVSRLIAGEVGAGSSMITVDYCLYSKLNGNVATAKQLHSRDKSGGLRELKENSAPSAIRKMASEVATQIDKDVREILTTGEEQE